MIRKKQEFTLLAIKSKKQEKQKIGVRNQEQASQCNFSLAVATKNEYTTATIVQQERNKMGLYQLAFIKKEQCTVSKGSVYCSFKIQCTDLKDKLVIAEEDFRKFLQELKVLFRNDDSEESSEGELSGGSSHLKGSHLKIRDKPKSNKSRKKQIQQNSSEEELYDKRESEKRGRGRPKGAKNKKKLHLDEILLESNVQLLFSTLIANQSIEEVSERVRNVKQKQQKMRISVKKEQQEESIKRGRGRPKGVKNKPKVNVDESDNEAVLNVESLPQRSYLQEESTCCRRCKLRNSKRAYLKGGEVRIQELGNLAYNVGIQDTTNLIVSTVKAGQIEQLRVLMGRKDIVETQFAIGWDCIERLENVEYTIRTRKEFISKRKRQGFNALLQDCYMPHRVWWKVIGLARLIEAIPNNPSGLEVFKVLTERDEELREGIVNHIPMAVRCGNEHLAAFLIESVLTMEDNATIYGYSKEHLECLSKKPEMQFKKNVMLKQNYTESFCSPIHCAAINSNHELLEYILKNISEFAVGDNLNRKPVHYSATLKSPKNLQILLKYGADLKDFDKNKMTPLMIAARFGRVKNLKLILEKVRDSQYINFKAADGMAAIHYAITHRHKDCLLLLLQDDLVDKLVETKQKMNLLHLAVGVGDKEIVQMVQEHGVGQQPDFFRRTPLMLAIRNHHNDIFFNLLFSSKKYQRSDYSHNSLLHYAAAYGNSEVARYLLTFMPQSLNKKGMYPYEVALLKGHYECAKIVQNWDYQYSQHLLNKISKTPRGTQEYYRIFNFLLQTGKYEINYRNLNDGNTCLHFVCAFSEKYYLWLRRNESSYVARNEFEQMQHTLITLLLKHGASPSVENDRMEKPVHMCINNENFIGIQLLLDSIPFEMPYPSKNNHFIYYLTHIAIRSAQGADFVLGKLHEADEKVLRSQLKKTDSQGFEFLVYLIKKFTQTVHTNFVACYQANLAGEDPLSFPGLKNRAVLDAFHQYKIHEEALIQMINFLVKAGSNPRAIILQPKVQKSKQNYKKWGIHHFLMKFPSPRLLRIFMKWIDTNFNLQNSEGRTPLHLFCKWNSEGSLFNCPALEQQGIKIDYQEMSDYEGKKCLEYLLENGLACNISDIYRSTPLLYAAINGKISFMRLLRMYGSSINNVNAMNQVPLIQVVKMKQKFNLQQIQSLLSEAGAKPDFQDFNQRNSLHHLVSHATNFDISPELCRKLIEYGAGINSLDSEGRSPVFYCFIRIDSGQHESANQEEQLNDKVEILQTLLNQEEINLNITDRYERTLLHYACQRNFFFSILCLLEKNINYDVPDAEGNTALAICLKHRTLNQAALLIKKGVKFGYVYENGVQYSYLTYAIQNKLSIGICFMLMDYGYPLQKALEEVSNDTFRKVLLKKYQ